MPEPITHVEPPGDARPGASVELDIRDLNSQGDGVGRAGELVVFVPGALLGERVLARIVRRRRSHAEARLVELVARSPSRIDPPCPHQSACGGCPLMVQEGTAALRSKVEHLEQTFRRVGGLALRVDRVVPSPTGLRYRGRVRFAVGGSKGAPRLGFRPRGRPRDLVDVADCLIAPDGATALAGRFLQTLSRVTVGDGRPWPRELEVRHSTARGSRLVVVHGPQGRWPEAHAAARDLVDRETSVAGVVLVTRSARGAPPRELVLAGRATIVETVAGFDVEIGATTFVQVNPRAAELLYRRVAEDLGRRPGGRLFDLYCGLGLVGLVAGDERCDVVGVESHAGSVRAARRAVRAAGRERIEILRGDAVMEAERLAALGETFERIAVNPPRAGMSPRLPDALSRLGAQLIVVVSCHPAALARDVAKLEALGFRPQHVTAVDMFPHTAHLEAIVRLEAAP